MRIDINMDQVRSPQRKAQAKLIVESPQGTDSLPLMMARFLLSCCDTAWLFVSTHLSFCLVPHPFHKFLIGLEIRKGVKGVGDGTVESEVGLLGLILHLVTGLDITIDIKQ